MSTTRMVEMIVYTMNYDDIYYRLLILENLQTSSIDAPYKAILNLNIECYRKALYISLEYI